MRQLVCAGATLCVALFLPNAASAAVTRIYPRIGSVSVTHIEHAAVRRTQHFEFEQQENGARPFAPLRPSRYRARLMASRQYATTTGGRSQAIVDVDVIHRDANPVSGLEMTRQYTLTYSARTGALLGTKVVPATSAQAIKYGLPADTFRHRIDGQTPSSTKRHP